VVANEKLETGEDWKTRYPRRREWLWFLGLMIFAVVFNVVFGLLILPDPAQKVTRWWAFWSEDSGNVRDLILIIAGIAGVPFVIWREVSTDRAARAAARQADIAFERHTKQTEADRERRITDSFTKAIELLGKPELEVRLGAIYALERIAHESKRDHWPIMETLAAYLRNKLSHAESAKGPPEPDGEKPKEKPTPLSADLEAVLTVFARRNWEYDPKGFRINLRGVRLSGFNLDWICLKKTDLTGAHLSKAGLAGADLRDAILMGADLSKAILTGAHLSKANLGGADLRDAILIGADLRGAKLFGADLRGAKLFGTDLRETYLTNLEAVENIKLCETIMPDGTVNDRDCPPGTQTMSSLLPSSGEEKFAPE
jgi:hypothetical protein